MIDPDINIHGDNIGTYKWLGNKGIENYNSKCIPFPVYVGEREYDKLNILKMLMV